MSQRKDYIVHEEPLSSDATIPVIVFLVTVTSESTLYITRGKKLLRNNIERCKERSETEPLIG